MHIELTDSYSDPISIQSDSESVSVRFSRSRCNWTSWTPMYFDDLKLITEFIKALEQARDAAFLKEDVCEEA